MYARSFVKCCLLCTDVLAYVLMDMNINRPADTAAGQRRKEKVYLITAVIVLICIAVSRIGIGVHNKAELKKFVTVDAVVTDVYKEKGEEEVFYYVTYDYTYNGLNYRQADII